MASTTTREDGTIVVEADGQTFTRCPCCNKPFTPHAANTLVARLEAKEISPLVLRALQSFRLAE